MLRYDDVRRILDDSETYSSHAYKGTPVRDDLRERIPEHWERVGQVIQGGQTINMDPPAHTTQRRALQRSFTNKTVDDAKPNIEAIAHELIDSFAGRGSCDLLQDFASQLTVRVVATMLALPQELQPGFLAWIGDVFAVLSPIDLKPEDVRIPDDQLTGTYERPYSADEIYTRFVEERRANPGEDLASAMLALTEEDGSPTLAGDQVLAHMIGITAAGTGYDGEPDREHGALLHREPGPAAARARRPVTVGQRDLRGAPPLGDRDPALPDQHPRVGLRGPDRPRRAATSSSASRRRTEIRRSSRSRSASTSGARTRRSISHSATAATTASAPAWRRRRRGSGSTRSTAGSRD